MGADMKKKTICFLCLRYGQGAFFWQIPENSRQGAEKNLWIKQSGEAAAEGAETDEGGEAAGENSEKSKDAMTVYPLSSQ